MQYRAMRPCDKYLGLLLYRFPVCTQNPLDIAILIDASGSITEEDARYWTYVVELARAFLSNFYISQDQVIYLIRRELSINNH